MADDKSKTNEGDRKRVAADQGYEVSYFARKHGLSSKDARALIERFGNDRDKLNAEAEKIAKGGRSARGTKSRDAGGSNNPAARTRPAGLVRTAKTSPVAKAAALGGVVAAGALLWSRRGKISDQISKLSDQLSGWRQGSDDAAGDFAVEGTTGDSSQVKSGPGATGGSRSQVEIAEEALTLKQMGQTP